MSAADMSTTSSHNSSMLGPLVTNNSPHPNFNADLGQVEYKDRCFKLPNGKSYTCKVYKDISQTQEVALDDEAVSRIKSIFQQAMVNHAAFKDDITSKEPKKITMTISGKEQKSVNIVNQFEGGAQSEYNITWILGQGTSAGLGFTVVPNQTEKNEREAKYNSHRPHSTSDTHSGSSSAGTSSVSATIPSTKPKLLDESTPKSQEPSDQRPHQKEVDKKLEKQDQAKQAVLDQQHNEEQRNVNAEKAHIVTTHSEDESEDESDFGFASLGKLGQQLTL